MRRRTKLLPATTDTGRARPRLGDLVSVDIPLEHDFKQYHSHWQAYRRAYFRAEYFGFELRSLSGWGYKKFRYGREAPRMFDLSVNLKGNFLRGIGSWFTSRFRIWSGELNSIRVIWPGDGQIQFGCGAKGLSIENQDSFLYLLRWSKVLTIYDAQDPKNIQLDKSHAHYQAALSTVRGILPAKKWAPKSLRVRLIPVSDPKSYEPDEIIIPKERFFGEGQGDSSWKVFLRTCWELKLAADHGDHHGSADAAVTVLPQHTVEDLIRSGIESDAGTSIRGGAGNLKGLRTRGHWLDRSSP